MKIYPKKGGSLHDRAAHIWQVLTPWVTWRMEDPKAPKGSGKITYGRLAEELGLSANAGRTLSLSVGAVSFFCSQNGLPPLNLIVVRGDTGEAGDEIPASDLGRENEVFEHDWRQYRTPSARKFREACEAAKVGI